MTQAGDGLGFRGVGFFGGAIRGLGFRVWCAGLMLQVPGPSLYIGKARPESWQTLILPANTLPGNMRD